MNNTHDGMPPVPLPDATTPTDPTIQGTAGRPRPKWVIPTIAAGCAIVLIAGGLAGHTAWTSHELAEAKAACAQAADGARVAANEYNALLNGDAADMAGVKADQVKDPKTVDTLTGMVKATPPEYEGCVADDKPGLDAAAVKLDKQATWYESHARSVRKAVKAVSDSKLEKTVDTANVLLRDSEGKVQDDSTRTALEKAVKTRDADAITAASKKVNESVAAKTKADEEARAKAEADAQAQAQAQAAQAQQSYTPTYSGGGYSGGGYTPTYTPSYTPAPQQPNAGGSSGGGTGGGSAPSIAPPISGGHGCGNSCPSNDGGGIYWH